MFGVLELWKLWCFGVLMLWDFEVFEALKVLKTCSVWKCWGSDSFEIFNFKQTRGLEVLQVLRFWSFRNGACILAYICFVFALCCSYVSHEHNDPCSANAYDGLVSKFHGTHHLILHGTLEHILHCLCVAAVTVKQRCVTHRIRHTSSRRWVDNSKRFTLPRRPNVRRFAQHRDS